MRLRTPGLLLSFAAAAAMIVACKRAAPTSTEPRDAASAVPLAPSTHPSPEDPVDKATAALVWLQRGSNKITSAWVEPGPSGPTVRLELPGAVVATPAGLFAVRMREGSVKVCATCGCDPAVPKSCKDALATVLEVTARSLPSGEPEVIERLSPEMQGCEEQLMSFDASVTNLSVVGSIVSFRASRTEVPCMAPHPMFDSAFISYDLDKHQKVSLAAPTASRPALARRAREQILLKKTAVCPIDDAEEAKPHAAQFEYDKEGTLTGRYTFTMHAPYACGSGPDHYSVAADVVDGALPVEVSPWRTAPAWLRPYLREHSIAGLSTLPAGLDRAAAYAMFASLPRADPPSSPSVGNGPKSAPPLPVHRSR